MSAIQQNYFDFFGLPVKFDIDSKILDSQYQVFQQRFHPDRYVTAPANEKLHAIQIATFANEAYTTLKNPTSRGIYLLSLHDISALDAENTQMSPDFLMLQITWREEIDEAVENKNEAQLDELIHTIKNKSSELLSQLEHAFNHHSLEEAKSIVRKLSFIDKIVADIHHHLEILEV
jgi:molecular chaperone HscB